MDEIDNPILTIGHSTHNLDAFIELLQKNHVNVLADVRSSPYSRFIPHFNRDSLANALKAYGIEYLFMGDELGGRSTDPACYEAGRIRYDRVAATESFQSGLEHVVRGSAKNRIALMCAEKEPLDCHRTLLVAQALDERSIKVAHIHANGELETHNEAMDRLLKQFNLQPEGELFLTREDLIAEAVDRQTKRVAFVDENLANTSSGATP